MSRYSFPDTTAEALEELETHQGRARILAGGTDLMAAILGGEVAPDVLIDITRIKELGQIRVESNCVTIGAAVTFADIKDHPFLQSHVPGLVQAAASIGAGGIQQTATLAGNIVQAMPAADGAIAALALESEALLCSSAGESWIPVSQLYRGPGQSMVDPRREFIKTIRFPLPPENTLWGTGWRRIGRRSALILPILNCAVKLVLEDSNTKPRIQKAVIALGPAGSIPLVAAQAAGYLTGKEPGERHFFRAGQLAAEVAHLRTSPLRASKEYRLNIIPSLVRDALIDAARGAISITSHPQ
jgi:carbon-monoxide dehydrogenase medium subunit